MIIGPDGQPMGAVPESALAMAGGPRGEDSEERAITDLVEQPAKVMRIGSMIRQLLEEVKAAPSTRPAATGSRRSTRPRSRSSRPGWRPSWSRSSSG